MLDEHFMDQMNELIRLCPRGRQTMLFSATMTDEVCFLLLYHVGVCVYTIGSVTNTIRFIQLVGEGASQVEPQPAGKVVCGQQH